MMTHSDTWLGDPLFLSQMTHKQADWPELKKCLLKMYYAAKYGKSK